MRYIINILEDGGLADKQIPDIIELLTSNIAICIYIIVFVLSLMILSTLVLVSELKKRKFVTKDEKLKKKLKKTKEVRKKLRNSKDRYQKLTKLDKQTPEYVNITSTPDLTLENICVKFRNYACKDLKLYYSLDDIRRYIASLGVSKILILQGMSGTGKTSLPVAFGRFIQHSTTVIPVQPMRKERSDLLGYYNEFTGKFNETMILEKLYEANQTDDMTIIVLDELNIARVEYYFSEFLSLLELPQASSRILEVSSTISKDDPKLLKNGKLQLSDNVWFIGTANNDDSTFAISDKVYDRSMILNLDYRCEPFVVKEETAPIKLSSTLFLKMIEDAKEDYSLTIREKRHIKELDKYVTKHFNITFGNRIMRQIEAYVSIYIACGGTEIEALDDILAKKLLRKLESQNPIYVKSHAEELCNKFDEIFGQDNMKVCQEYIRKIARNS